MLLFKEGTNVVVGSVPLKPVQDKPRTSILSRRLRGSVELKIFYRIGSHAGPCSYQLPMSFNLSISIAYRLFRRVLHGSSP